MPLNVTFDNNFNEIPPLVDGDYKSTVKLTSYMQNDKRRVSMPPKDCSAVEVRRLRYVVGRRSKPKIILSGINMTVPEGAIYGLLGPSGSGKTTLLKSVVGQLTPTEGWVKVFGFQPNQPGSQIPGPAIGYMPQELAVYEDFTIKETLWYFGRLYRIPKKVIKERIEFLTTFLDLPRSKRLIVNMSGGQKRRVSLASALVHSPPLLILDEPTVGVDPLLRQSIWQHLVTLTQTEKITVIVTTHYIEEARRANIVGLMRRGKLLAENAPDDLMAKHDSSSLEDVFLKLCVSDTMRRAQKFASLTGLSVHQAITGSSSVIPTPEIESKRKHCSSSVSGVTTSDSSSSQSPDEGVNTNHSSSSDSSVEQNCVNTKAVNSKQDKSSGSGSGKQQVGEHHQQRNSSPTYRSSSDSEATAEVGSCVAQIDNANNGGSGENSDSVDSSTLSNMVVNHKIFATNAQLTQINQQPSRAAKRFQLKSLFKFGNQSTANMAALKAVENRRQSGTHFIEQLMSKYQHEQQQMNMQQPNTGKPFINQLLSCDTINNNNSSSNNSNGNNQLQLQQINVHHDQNRLSVPKIAIQGSYDDSGASSNGSSQNHSPVGNQSQLNSSSNNNNNNKNNLVAAAYNNHSYQHSECGSTTYHDLALISSSAINNQQQSAGAANNHHQQQASSDHKIQIDDDLNDDIMLDPELFMNPADLSTMSPGNKYDYKTQNVSEYCNTIGTITWKNYIRLKRNVPLLLFQFVLPAIQVILFCICVGNDPFDISVAVVNEETSASTSIAALSTQFLNSIDSHLVKQVNFTNLNMAIDSVKSGKNWGVIHIPENFTLSIHKRFAGLEGEVDDITLENSTIKVYPDMTNQPIGHAMEVAFRRAYNDLSKQTFEFLGLNPALSDPPIRMESAIYGKIDMQNYLQYMSPGVLISISYIMATGLTSLAFITERRDGLYDRTLAAGVDQIQMLISHSIVQLVVMIVQISLVVFFTFVIYKVPTNGPFIWVFILLLLQGLAGMSFGLMVSAICREENTAIMMILGTFYPNLLLAGVIWPIEAIPHWLRWFSYLQPQTLPTQSLRDLIVRGWDIDQPGVWSGFAVTSIWLLLFLAISCISFRLKK